MELFRKNFRKICVKFYLIALDECQLIDIPTINKE